MNTFYLRWQLFYTFEPIDTISLFHSQRRLLFKSKKQKLCECLRKPLFASCISFGRHEITAAVLTVHFDHLLTQLSDECNARLTFLSGPKINGQSQLLHILDSKTTVAKNCLLKECRHSETAILSYLHLPDFRALKRIQRLCFKT